MMNQGYKKYKPFTPIDLPDRQWPNRVIDHAPIWCSVDLRDGNQALVDPMNLEEKLEYFKTLIEVGFKEIEVGFPSASETEYEILRTLIDGHYIPDDVTIQVLVQARPHLIKKTFEAIDGAKNVIVHFYNSTSTLQRKVVFKTDMDGVIQIAVDGARLIYELTEEEKKRHPEMNIRFEYSPESFTGTEMDNAVEICRRVMEELHITKENPIILNLPSTVEGSSPNGYADQIEYFCRHLPNRDAAIISLHPHNDRGEGVAATELALMAGADRVEGTLFGNGERTGNVDVVTLALNMWTQGVDPTLDFHNINAIKEVYERCTKMQVPPRQPYAGELVFTAFSGSHQDAINKGLQVLHERNSQYWEVPYLPIDPSDIGRQYEPIVRINSQSGKGGVAFVMDTFYGFKLPKGMHKEFADVIQKISEQQGEVAPEQIMEEFRKNYLDKKEPIHFRKCQITDTETGEGEFATLAKVTYTDHGMEKTFEGVGNGPIDAVQRGLEDALGIQIKVLDYNEHALNSGSNAQAASYIHLMDKDSGRVTYGVGVSSNITRSSIRGIFSAVNRLFFS